ncbi:MAG: SDR family NAD(P)-dependent oxidoreductase [Ornithinimicrobium sp.]|jgi:3-oxoacyl-[acyl-carrier protein] reductase|uniref:SDR family NAD(P)-dependent oxidoreductase n=1 Tax=Ornithinimicrobium sp. TaxID=1977084 RepID=UPI003D9BE277
MDVRFDDTTVLVTGASTGGGAAVAAGFGASGARVAVHYNSSGAAATAVADGIRAGGGEAWTVQADLSLPGGAAALAAAVHEHWGGIDVLVNNTGGLVERRPTGELSQDLSEQVFQLNVGSLTELVNAYPPGTPQAPPSRPWTRPAVSTWPPHRLDLNPRRTYGRDH